MMNYIVLYVMYDIIKCFLYVGNDKMYDIKESVLLFLDWFVFIIDGLCLYWGIIVVILIVILMWFLLDWIILGYELKLVGFN